MLLILGGLFSFYNLNNNIVSKMTGAVRLAIAGAALIIIIMMINCIYMVRNWVCYKLMRQCSKDFGNSKSVLPEILP